MKIRWIGQSGYIITTAATEIIIDPYLSDVVNRVANRPRMVEPPISAADIKADAVICSHNHLDHLDTDAVVLMPDEQKFITTLEGKDKLAELGKTNISTLVEGESTVVGDIELTAVYAKHTVEAFGLILKAEDKTLYFSGDTLFDEKLFEISRFCPDVAFICINGKLGNMDYKEAAVVADKIGAKVSVPTHYGMFESNTEDPTKFTSLVNNSKHLEFNRTYSIEEIL